jgi:dihydroxyacetone kinase
MTRLQNDPLDFVDQALDGFVWANQRYVRRVSGGIARTIDQPPGQVAVVIGGGSGHYPAFAGLVGSGMATAAVCGNIFSSPSSAQVSSVVEVADTGAGVVLSYGNYAGDVIHFGEAQERLRRQGHDVRTVLVTDDIASAPPSEIHKRRGIAGDFVVFKIAGAAAERGDALDEVERLARFANDRTRSLGVAFSGCVLPGATTPLFTVPSGLMSVGLGIHGEPGVADQPLVSADELAALFVQRLLNELPRGIQQVSGQRVAVVVNGLGTVKYEELFVLMGCVCRDLTAKGIELVDPECGELVTSLDMGGVSLTLCWLDDELEPLWRATADAPAYRKSGTTPRTVAPTSKTQGASLPATTARVASEQSRQAGRRYADFLARATAIIAEQQGFLGDLDAIAGDGDHGQGMILGLTAASESASSLVETGAGIDETLEASGSSWADRAGGTSGALWGAALRAAGESLADSDLSDDAIVAAVWSALDRVKSLGNARVGDKTMVDAWEPFALALQHEIEHGFPLREAWTRASAVATSAAGESAALLPQLGRARPLAERSVGHPDPGATSFAIIVSSALG